MPAMAGTLLPSPTPGTASRADPSATWRGEDSNPARDTLTMRSIPAAMAPCSSDGNSGGVNYLTDAYRLFGSTTPSQSRDVTRFSTEVGLTSISLGDFSVRGKVGIANTSVKDVRSVRETPFGLSGSASKDFAGFSLLGGLELWAHPYNAPSAGSDPFYASLAAEARTEIPGNVELSGGLGFFVFHGSDLSTSVRLYPRASVLWHASSWMSFFVRFDPAVRRLTLGEVLDANPYASGDFALRHAERYIDLSLGTEMNLSRTLALRLSANYSRANNALAFVDTGRTGIWKPYYDGASTMLAFIGDVTWSVTAHDLLAGSIGFRSSKNSVTGNRIPYVPVASAEAFYEHRFAFPLTLGAGMRIVGQRTTDLAENRSLKAFTLINATAAYEFLPRWQAILRVDNLLNVKYQWWEGYAGVPARGFLGVSFSW
jgi:hypothetical protein